MNNPKKILLFIITVYLVFHTSAFAQWSTVFDDGKYYLRGIDFKDENTGFVGGRNLDNETGVILRSTDGGINWEEVFATDPYIAGPFCFDFVDDTLGFSGGQDGMLYKSIDGGSTWAWYSHIPGLWDINVIKFFNNTIGIAGFSRTIDGGYTWEPMEIGYTNDIFLTNDSSGFTATNEGLFYTSEYGANWLKVNPGENEEFLSVCMATELVGYATKKQDKIFKTIDGGMSWYKNDSLPVFEANQIRFIDEFTGYVLANNFGVRVFKTVDGGDNWDFVLFGTDKSYQMALTNEETILVPTLIGTMYKTSNGGGEPILPKYTEIDWYSTLKHPGIFSQPISCINSLSQPYLAGVFKDTLFVNGSPTLISLYPQNTSTYILRYNDTGSLEWSSIIEKSDKKVSGGNAVIDTNNNYYLIYSESELYPSNSTTNLIKYSPEGDSLWAMNLSDYDTIYIDKMNITPDNHLLLSGRFDGTLIYENSSIHTDNWGIFMLELDENGNFISLTKVVESTFIIERPLLETNTEGSLCLSFASPGTVYINADTLDPSYYYLLSLDQTYDIHWYNTEFNQGAERIFNITFNKGSKILIKGRDKIDDLYYNVVYQYDEQGLKTDSAIINPGTVPNSGNNGLCPTTNNEILISGNYDNLSILEDDTLYGFDWHRNNSFIYSLSDNLQFYKSSHISGTRNITNILEDQNTMYIVGDMEWENVIFANDTIPSHNNSFIARLTSDPSNVSENILYQQLSIHPNPTTGSIYIKSRIKYKTGYVEVFDIIGKKVYTSYISEKQNSVNLSKLKDGIYIIQSNLDGKIFTQKIIIQ